jgi:hypothetical protein
MRDSSDVSEIPEKKLQSPGRDQAPGAIVPITHSVTLVSCWHYR